MIFEILQLLQHNIIKMVWHWLGIKEKKTIYVLGVKIKKSPFGILKEIINPNINMLMVMLLK